MPKRSKSASKSSSPIRPASDAAAAPTAHPPAKNPSLLAVSIILFALWFVFLLITALVG